MSYSFNVKAATKDEAGQKVEQELATVVANQPVHTTDRQATQNVAEAFINMLAEPGDGECVHVNVSGSLGWRAEGVFTHSNVSVSARIAPAD